MGDFDFTYFKNDSDTVEEATEMYFGNGGHKKFHAI